MKNSLQKNGFHCGINSMSEGFFSFPVRIFLFYFRDHRVVIVVGQFV
jgi:hypothetical protein